MQDSVVSHNTASKRGSVFDVDSAHTVKFLNVTFEYNSGTAYRLHALPRLEVSPARIILGYDYLRLVVSLLLHKMHCNLLQLVSAQPTQIATFPYHILIDPFQTGLLPIGAMGCGYCLHSKGGTNIAENLRTVAIKMTGCRWRHNSAQSGGAIYASKGCRLNVTDTDFESNHAQVQCTAKTSISPTYA